MKDNYGYIHKYRLHYQKDGNSEKQIIPVTRFANFVRIRCEEAFPCSYQNAELFEILWYLSKQVNCREDYAQAIKRF